MMTRRPLHRVQAALAARRYFIDQRTKSEIAEEMNLSRFKVARLIDEAIAEGIIQFKISEPDDLNTALGDALAAALPFLDVVNGILLLTAPAGGGPFDEAALKRTITLSADTPIIVDGGIEPRHFETLRQAPVELVTVGRTLFDFSDIAQRARRLSQELK